MSTSLDGGNSSMRKVCWPSEWIAAAIKAGLAEAQENGAYVIHGGEEMREKLQIFASEIVENIRDAEAAR